MFAILGLLLVTSNNSESASRIKQAAQVCSNGLAGVERAGACCVAECGTCGGSVCGDQAAAAGLTADDCCIGRIKQAEVYCGDSGVAPCLIDDGKGFGQSWLTVTHFIAKYTFHICVGFMSKGVL